MRFFNLFSEEYRNNKQLASQLEGLLGFKPRKLSLYITALTHRSMAEGADKNNERLEYLGDAILSSIVADYLFKRYPYKDEGFLTEMRSKMVNRVQLNDIAIKMGFKKITYFNKIDNGLKMSQIFGNTLEAVLGALFLETGYEKTRKWVVENMIQQYMFMDDLELVEMNLKNKLYGWANKQGKLLEFETIDEKLDGGRKLFTVGAMVDGVIISVGKGFNKKDASQVAAQIAIDSLGLNKEDTFPVQ